MAFIDWELDTSGGGTASLQTTGALNGSSSVETTLGGGSNRSLSLNVTAGSGITRNIGRGKIRTIIRQTQGTSIAEHAGGIFCLASSINWGAASGNAYHASFNAGNGNISLVRGPANSPDITILQTFNAGFTVGATFTLELEWNEDSAGEIGGTHLIVRTGSAINYSDLTERFQYIDASASRLTLSGGYEGICHLHDSGASNSIWLFDDTTIFTVS